MEPLMRIESRSIIRDPDFTSGLMTPEALFGIPSYASGLTHNLGCALPTESRCFNRFPDNRCRDRFSDLASEFTSGLTSGL